MKASWTTSSASWPVPGSRRRAKARRRGGGEGERGVVVAVVGGPERVVATGADEGDEPLVGELGQKGGGHGSNLPAQTPDPAPLRWCPPLPRCGPLPPWCGSDHGVPARPSRRLARRAPGAPACRA